MRTTRTLLVTSHTLKWRRAQAASTCDELSLYGFIDSNETAGLGRFHYWDEGPPDARAIDKP